MIVPPMLLPLCKDSLGQMTTRVANGSRVLRSQLTVDLALMRYVAKKNAFTDRLLYIWVDSSPQAGGDWLVSSYLWIHGRDVVVVASQAHAMFRSVSEWHEAFDKENDLGQQQRLIDIVMRRSQLQERTSAAIRMHKQIPIALGHMNAGLAAKTRSLIQAFHMESAHREALQHTLGNVVAITTDMGVEMGVADAAGGGFDNYIPSWMRSRLDDEIGIDFVVPHAHSDRHPFPNSMLSGGVLHIIDVSEKHLDKSLAHWDKWFPGLLAITRLLGTKHHRERFIDTCIRRDERFRGEVSIFGANVHSTVHWRWGAVIDVLHDLENNARACFARLGHPPSSWEGLPLRPWGKTTTLPRGQRWEECALNLTWRPSPKLSGATGGGLTATCS